MCACLLMSYQYEIAKSARKFKWPSGVIYDINFCQEAASYRTLSWADAAGHREPKIDQQCFNGMEKNPMEGWCRLGLSLDHITSLCPCSPTLPQQQPIHQRKQPMVDPYIGSRRFAGIITRKGANTLIADIGMSASSAMEAILNIGAPYNPCIRQFIQYHFRRSN